jgi:caa(3)-type oxidase subunit IV
MSEHHDVNYKKIYFTLLALLVASVVGPLLGDRFGLTWLTLITAFGIAIVKAQLVINNFMHLRWEKRIVKWLLTTSLLLMALLFAGVAPDVMNHEGNNWENIAAQAAVERGIDGTHGEGEGGEPEVEVVVGFSAEATFTGVCAACHGVTGDGTGVAAAALDPKPADFTLAEFWETRDRERIVTVIRDGAAAVGGSPLMIPWRLSYDEEQIEQLADYVMSLRPNE